MGSVTELLGLLCCPETHQALRAATPAELAFANRTGVLNRAGRVGIRSVKGGLVREDGLILYPVWDEIPCLLIEEGIPLKVQPVAV